MTPKKTKIANNLVGASAAEVVQNDQLISSLSAPAKALIKPPAPADRVNRKSRFWFKVETTEQFLAQRKAKLVKAPIEHIDSEVQKRVSSYTRELAPSLQEKIETIREFFLKEIAPLTLASSGGTTQAREVAQRTLGIEIDSAMFSRFEKMVNMAATLKLSKFVAELFGLPENSAAALTGSPNNNTDPGLHHLMEELKAMASTQGRKEIKELKSGMAKIERLVSEKGK
jgi:hypothetical protein